MFLKHAWIAGEVTRRFAVAVVDVDAAGGLIDGVLGMDLLGERAIDVDLRVNRLVLHRKGDAGFRSSGLAWTDYTPLDGGQIALRVTLDGHPATAILDLGANHTFANAHVGLASDGAGASVSAAIGADRHDLMFRPVKDVVIGLGELALRAPSVWIGDLPIFQTFGIADRSAVLLGVDALAGRRIVIDPFSQRIYVSR